MTGWLAEGETSDAKRYPWEPLERLLMLRLGPGSVNVAFGKTRPRDWPTAQMLAEHVGIAVRQVYRWRRRGLSRLTADRAAVAAGYLPYLIWPDWLDDSIAAVEAEDAANSRECAAEDCDRMFLAGPSQRFCSKRCQRRAAETRRRPTKRARDIAQRKDRYARDPEHRRAMLAYQRTYQAHPVIAEQRRQYRRDYYKKNREREIERQRLYDARKRARRDEAA